MAAPVALAAKIGFASVATRQSHSLEYCSAGPSLVSVGDVIDLRVTVNATRGDDAECVWFDPQDHLHNIVVPQAALIPRADRPLQHLSLFTILPGQHYIIETDVPASEFANSEVRDSLDADLKNRYPESTFVLLARGQRAQVDSVSIRKRAGDIEVEYRGHTVEECQQLAGLIPNPSQPWRGLNTA
jgi:hypothetical protein